MEQKKLKIPVITDVERNIDGINMIRCSYYSLQSDDPMPNSSMNIFGSNSQMLILNLDVILIGPSQNVDRFSSMEDIDLMYDLMEENEGFFVDINDIWIPASWFENEKIRQGMVYRISQEKFILCWKLRNDHISSEEFIAESKKIKEVYIAFSKEETLTFQSWTNNQIEKSREIYQGNRTNYLQKIEL